MLRGLDIPCTAEFQLVAGRGFDMFDLDSLAGNSPSWFDPCQAFSLRCNVRTDIPNDFAA
jgi:hypothetical protein